MAKGDWPKSYIIPSVILSMTAAGFLLWHVLDPARQIDGWAITLLVVGFLPWLRTVFESIDLPGGASVKYLRAVEAKQEQQAQDIDALRFMLARFITDGERALLHQLDRGEPVPFERDHTGQRLMDQAKSLHRVGLIAPKPSVLEANRNGTALGRIATINELYDVTPSGQQYLDLIADLPSELMDIPADPTRPA